MYMNIYMYLCIRIAEGSRLAGGGVVVPHRCALHNPQNLKPKKGSPLLQIYTHMHVHVYTQDNDNDARDAMENV